MRHRWKDLLDEQLGEGWYAPIPGINTHQWDFLSRTCRARSAEAIGAIDQASRKVVANLGDPHIKKLKRKGLVLGYVQSGKTANYAATIAKAADAGFRFFIVIAGIHNNLRSQTQDRLDQDVIGTGRPGGIWKWESLTDSERDFGKPIRANWILNDPSYQS